MSVQLDIVMFKCPYSWILWCAYVRTVGYFDVLMSVQLDIMMCICPYGWIFWCVCLCKVGICDVYVSVEFENVMCLCPYGWILLSVCVCTVREFCEVLSLNISICTKKLCSNIFLHYRRPLYHYDVRIVIRRHFPVGSDTVQWGCKIFVWGKLPSVLNFSKSKYILKQTFRLNRLNIFKTSTGISEYLTDFKGQLKLYKEMKRKKTLSFSTFILPVRKEKLIILEHFNCTQSVLPRHSAAFQTSPGSSGQCVGQPEPLSF